MNVRDRQAGGAALKALRRRRGLSLAETARGLLAQLPRTGLPRSAFPDVAGVQRSLARWESVKAVLPADRYQLLLAHFYARTPSGDFATGPGSDCAQLLEALAYLGEGTARLECLRDTVLRGATDDGRGLLAFLAPSARDTLAAALTDPGQTDHELVHGLDRLVSEVNAQVGSLPFVRLQLLLAPAVEACRRLLVGPVPEVVLEELRGTAASVYVLAGRLAFETRDSVASQLLYREATQTAGLLTEPWRRAVVQMSHALVTLYSTSGLEQAHKLINSAVMEAQSGGSLVVRARAHALQAEIAARMGKERHAQAALGLAWYDVESDHSGDPSADAFSVEHLQGFEGVCQLHTGDPRIAHDHFARSAAALKAPRERIQRVIVITDQALARLRMGEPQAAVELLHGCIDAVSETGGRVPAIRLRRTRRELKPWRGERFVAELEDHLMDLVGA